MGGAWSPIHPAKRIPAKPSEFINHHRKLQLLFKIMIVLHIEIICMIRRTTEREGCCLLQPKNRQLPPAPFFIRDWGGYKEIHTRSPQGIDILSREHASISPCLRHIGHDFNYRVKSCLTFTFDWFGIRPSKSRQEEGKAKEKNWNCLQWILPNLESFQEKPSRNASG